MIEQFVTGGVLIGSGCLAVAASRAVLVGVLRLMTVRAANYHLPADEDASPART